MLLLHDQMYSLLHNEILLVCFILEYWLLLHNEIVK